MDFSGASAVEAGRRQRGVNHRFVVAVSDVRHSRKRNKSGREYAGFVAWLGSLDAVCGHKDGAREGVEFLCLILPCAAVIADEMAVFFQRRIAMGGQHLPVRVNIDAQSLRLFEQFFEILQVVSGNENRLAFDRGDAHARRYGIAVCAGMCGIEHFHDRQVYFAALHV